MTFSQVRGNAPAGVLGGLIRSMDPRGTPEGYRSEAEGGSFGTDLKGPRGVVRDRRCRACRPGPRAPPHLEAGWCRRRGCHGDCSHRLGSSPRCGQVKIAERASPFGPAIQLLCTIPGVRQTTAETFVAETGGDMSRFRLPGIWRRGLAAPRQTMSRPESTAPLAAAKEAVDCVEMSSSRPGRRRGPRAPTSAPSTADSPADADRTRPSSRSPTRSLSSPGTCSATARPTRSSSPTGSTSAPTLTPRPGASSGAANPSATRSPSAPPPEQPSLARGSRPEWAPPHTSVTRGQVLRR